MISTLVSEALSNYAFNYVVTRHWRIFCEDLFKSFIYLQKLFLNGVNYVAVCQDKPEFLLFFINVDTIFDILIKTGLPFKGLLSVRALQFEWRDEEVVSDNNLCEMIVY